jgi:hypothetical protein
LNVDIFEGLKARIVVAEWWLEGKVKFENVSQKYMLGTKNNDDKDSAKAYFRRSYD